MSGQILVIEDDRDMGEMLKVGLGRRGFQVTTHCLGREGLAAVDPARTDIILADLNLPDINGLDICREISDRWPEIPVVIMTAFGSMDTAIAALRAGAYDFITKPVDLDLLGLALARAGRHRQLERTVRLLSEAGQPAASFGELLGESKVMQELFVKLQRISDSDASVLITGESGSGKELTARALHRHGRRRDGPFIAINCTAMPANLLESELFGHVRGAITDAHTDRRGLFMEAHGGTLFLDEIGEIPLVLQPKLLRALEQRMVRPVGGNTEQSFDVRILAATNRDLETAIEERSFREDLFYRLNVIDVEVPPLRVRGNDILLLAEKFCQHYAAKQGKQVKGLSEATARRLLAYRWPGNVRELRNAVEHAVALALHERLLPEDLPEKVLNPKAGQLPTELLEAGELPPLEEMVQRYLGHVLAAAGGNQSLAAKILGVDRKTLHRRMQRQGG